MEVFDLWVQSLVKLGNFMLTIARTEKVSHISVDFLPSMTAFQATSNCLILGNNFGVISSKLMNLMKFRQSKYCHLQQVNTISTQFPSKSCWNATVVCRYVREPLLMLTWTEKRCANVRRLLLVSPPTSFPNPKGLQREWFSFPQTETIYLRLWEMWTCSGSFWNWYRNPFTIANSFLQGCLSL
jgi:hypothetical protein